MLRRRKLSQARRSRHLTLGGLGSWRSSAEHSNLTANPRVSRTVSAEPREPSMVENPVKTSAQFPTLCCWVSSWHLVPVVGSTIAGVVVAAVALTVSLPVCIATTVFFVVFRLAEDYLLVPKIIGRAVKVPALITVVAVLIGGALLGIVGALVAIPIAAALQLLTQEVLFPRLDNA